MEQTAINECNSPASAENVKNTNNNNQKDGKSSKMMYSVQLKNLNKKTKRDVLFKHLHTALSPEDIVQVFVRRDEGFIKLKSKEAVEKALKLNGTELDGRRIHVKDPNDKKREFEEENISDNPPIKKQKKEEEAAIIYEKCSSGDDDDEEEEEEEHDDDDHDGKDEDEKNNTNQKLPSKKLEKKSIKKQNEHQLVNRYAAFIGNIGFSTTDNQVRTFIESIVAPEDIKRLFLPKCKRKPRGFGFVELATKEALERVLKLDGSSLMGRHVRVRTDDKEKKSENENNGVKKNLKGSKIQSKKNLKGQKIKSKKN